MDDLIKTISDLKSKTANCSKSEKKLTLDYLKKIICHLENAAELKNEEENNKSVKVIKQKSPLKLTIRKFKTSTKPNNDVIINNDNVSSKAIIKTRNWCSVCKRNFLSQKALNKHLLSYMHKVNSGEVKMCKTFMCEECGHSFNKMVCLQRHISSIHNDFAHRCNLCDYITSEKCNLTEHMRRHYQIRNFVCEFCDTAFIAKRELKDHVAFKHNSQRPFKCSDCGKMFKTSRILRRHIKIHSEFKPYICACGSGFQRMTNLRRHLLSVHHDRDPVITKVYVEDEDDEDEKVVNDDHQVKEYWYADSKYIKNKKTPLMSLNKETLVEQEPSPGKEDASAGPKTSEEEEEEEELTNERSLDITDSSSHMNMFNVNYMVKMEEQEHEEEEEEEEEESKMYWTINENLLDQSDTNEIILDTSSLTEMISSDKSSSSSSSSPSLVQDQSLNISDLVSSSPSLPTDDVTKVDNMCKYQVECLMTETSDPRTIWRPMDLEDQAGIMIEDDRAQIFPHYPPSLHNHHLHDPGLISSFNEVFLSPVSSSCYPPDESGPWTSMSNSFLHPDHQNSTYIFSGPVSADSSASSENMFYNHPQSEYMDAYASVRRGGGGGLGGGRDTQHGSSSRNSQILPSSGSASISQIMFNHDHPEFLHHHSSPDHPPGTLYSISSWLQSPPSSSSSSRDPLPPLLSSSCAPMSQSNVSTLSPIDFFMSDNVFSSGLKHQYCLSSFQDDEVQDSLHDNPFISDFCTQTLQFSHPSPHQLCSNNFSVLNLISGSSCGSSSADNIPGIQDVVTDDLLYSEVDELSVL